jgi:hypothetical protein
MIARNSNSPPPPTTMLAQTMVIGPQTTIVNGEGGKLGIFWKVYELISMIVEDSVRQNRKAHGHGTERV